MRRATERSDGPALGVVLAGGRGSRLGGAKATALLGGRPLISYALQALRAAGLEAVVAVKADTELPDLDCELVMEPQGPSHPLCGIVAALADAHGRPIVVVACDMPFAEPALLAYLAARDRPLVVPAPAGELQPLLARYGPELADRLAAAVDDAAPLRRTVSSLGPQLLDTAALAPFGDPDRMFFNINSTEDLRQAGLMLVEPAR